MTEPHWLSKEIIISVHDALLARFGGLRGIRDEGMLDSAINKPVQLFSYGEPDLFDLASAYAAGIIRNHPFVDGNKRSGFMAAYVFLGINGHRLVAPEEQAVLQTLALAAGEIGVEAYAAWLKGAV